MRANKLNSIHFPGCVTLLLLSQLSGATNAAAAPHSQANFALSCTAKVIKPAQFRTAYQQIMVFDGSPEYTNIPAGIAWNEVDVQVMPARYPHETVPAVYEDTIETVQVERERIELFAVPASYRTEQRNIKIRDAYQRWKPGCLASLSDCIEYVPEAYKSFTVKIIDTPAKIQQKRIPGKTVQIPRKVLVKPGQGTGKPLPAKYETVRVSRVKTPWEIRTTPRPTRYEQVPIKRLVHEGTILEAPTWCAAQAPATQIRALQNSLVRQGYSVVQHGQWDARTRQALLDFQQEHRLPTGGVTIETLRQLKLLQTP